MKKLNPLHNLFCDDLTYQEYFEQIKTNGQYSVIKELLSELNTYSLLRLYKYEGSPVIQGYIEEEFNNRIKKQYRG